MPDVAATGMLLADDLRDDEAFPSLLRALRRADGFELLIAVCNEPARRAGLMDRIDASLGTSALRIAVPADCDDALAVVEAALRAAPAPPGAVMVVGLGNGIRSTAPEHPRLRALNHRREEWAEVLHVPVVLWIPEYLLGPLARQAPDFLDWRSGTFLFLPPLAIGSLVGGPVPENAIDDWRLTEAERRARMYELQTWLAALPRRKNGRPEPAAVRWKLELAVHHISLSELDDAMGILRDEVIPTLDDDSMEVRTYAWSLVATVRRRRGDLDEAVRICRDVLIPACRNSGDIEFMAVVHGQIADAMQARGDFDEALRIRRDEELPIYESLGNARLRAIAWGKIAEVLKARGDLDGALRIHRDEELPVYQSLGDVWSRAMTLGQIADILQARGDLDEALRIRREEELPVYERMGDVRSQTVTLGRIADVREARGEFDEALRIRREQELPVYERLGDVREQAVTASKIADVLKKQGHRDEAIRIYRQDVLPHLEQLGRQHDLLHARMNLSSLLFQRAAPGDRSESAMLVKEALAAAVGMQIPEAEEIRRIQKTLFGRGRP